MDMTALHQAEHLAREAAHHQGLPVEIASKGIQRGHDVCDGAVAVPVGVRRLLPLRLLPQARIRFLHHLFAEVHAHQVVLKDVVIEHVLGGFAQIDDPLTERGRLDAERHVLRITRAGGVVVAADPADAAGDEMRVPRVLAFHEDAVPAEDGRGAVALRHLFVLEINLGEDTEAAHDAGYGVPAHLDQIALLSRRFGQWLSDGSHMFILSRSRSATNRTRSVRAGLGLVTGDQLTATAPPLGLAVHGIVGDRTQRPDQLSVQGECGSRKARPGGLVHERHEHVGKSGHGAADTDAAHIGASTDATHPAALGDVAVDHGAPASHLHQTFRGAVFDAEIVLLVVGSAVAAFMNRFAEQPGGAQLLIQWDHGRQTRRLIEQVEQGLHKVVGLHWTAWNVDDWQAGLGTPPPAQIVGQSHALRRIAGHGVNAAVSSAGPGADNGERFGRKPVDPLASSDRLAGVVVGALRGPVAFILDLFVWDRAFDYENERVEFAALGLVEVLHEIIAHLVGEHRVVQVHLRQARDGSHDYVFNAWLLGVGHGDGITVAAKASGDPDDVDFVNGSGRGGFSSRERYRFRWHQRLLSGRVGVFFRKDVISYSCCGKYDLPWFLDSEWLPHVA